MTTDGRLNTADLHSDLRNTFRFIPHVPPWATKIGEGSAKLIRRIPGPGAGSGVDYSDISLGDGVRILVYAPATGTAVIAPCRGAALVWIHGGGLITGAAHQEHSFIVPLVRELGITVVSVDYRLAPAHPYPAAIDDCAAAWAWTTAHTDDLGIDRTRIALGGESAGGGLAAALAQRLHDEDGTAPVAQWLFAPMLDDRTAADHSYDPARHFLWDNRANRAGWGAYLGHPAGQDTAPPYAVAARRDDLSGLPPAWLGGGDAELFHDEIVAYAGRLRDAGVDVTPDIVPSGPHAFERIAAGADVSKAYLARATDWLREQLQTGA
jgi:acetyl esterase/lipase